MYALVVSKITKEKYGNVSNAEDCRKTVVQMGDRNQTIKVRIKADVLLGFLAKYDSLSSTELYE